MYVRQLHHLLRGRAAPRPDLDDCLP